MPTTPKPTILSGVIILLLAISGFRLCFGQSCLAAASVAGLNISVPRIIWANSELRIREWLILGPFQTIHGGDALQEDFLTLNGSSETMMRSESYVRLIKKEHHNGGVVGPAYRPVVSGIVDFMNLFRKDIRPGEGQGAAYAACVIESSANQKVWLIAGSDDSLKVWLNGQLVHEHADARPLRLYDDVAPLNLRRGSNFLLVKVGNIIGSWELAASLEPAFGDAFRRTVQEDPLIFRNSVLESPSPMLLWLDGIPTEIKLQVEFESTTGAHVMTTNINGGPVNLPTGLYRAKIFDNKECIGASFCMENPVALLDIFRHRAERFMCNDKTAINLDTLFRRWTRLLMADANRPSDRDWQEKMLFVAVEVDEILGNLEAGREAYAGIPGMHLRGFRSKIDDQVQNYRLYVPPSYREKGPAIPVIIMLATAVSASRPFLESAFIANQKEAVAMGKVAANLGAAIIWPGYRCRPYGNPCEFTHLDEVLAEVEADYHIDLSRISMVGTCGAGIVAAMAADMCPKRFSAISFVNPVLYRLKNRYDDSGEYRSINAYRAWLHETDPVDQLAKIPDLPIWVVHDSIDPDHGPLSHAVDFVELARANGQNPRWEYTSEPFSERIQLWRRLFTWMVRQKRASNNLDSSEFKCGKETGPISRAFAERFILVEATGGDAEERLACEHISRSFQDAWKRTQYGPCRVVVDTMLSPETEMNSNIVLIGNERTNAIWKRLAGKIPLIFNRETIQIAGHTYRCNGLSLQAVFRNPDYPDRKIVFVGSENLGTAVFGTQELAIDGWFDYAIWVNDSGRPRLFAAERRRK